MKTIRVDPLTRVEGHGRVELEIRHGRLTGVRVALSESLRLFEAMVLGRPFSEVPELVCRICAICSSVHRIAAASAFEKALGVMIPPAARVLRDLLLLGGHIESHALHLFCLVLPDLFERQSLLELLREGSSEARAGLELKALGNAIQEKVGGRMIHPINVEVGGVLHFPDPCELESLRRQLEVWEKKIGPLMEGFRRQESYPSFTPLSGRRISVCNGPTFSLNGDSLMLSDGQIVSAESYAGLLAEKVVPYSNAKQSGDAKTPWLTGALARLENHGLCGARSLPLPEFAGIFANNAAQAIEMVWALQESRRLIEELLSMDRKEPLSVPVRGAAGIGTTAIEAPRGLLVHHYVLDDLGRVAAADIVTPTAINQAAMETAILNDLQGLCDETEMARRAECIVRAFDPCISCAVHLMRAP